MHVLIRLALSDQAKPSPKMLDEARELDDGARQQIARLMVTLAGGALDHPAAWAGLLVEHLEGAMRERAAAPLLGERH